MAQSFECGCGLASNFANLHASKAHADVTFVLSDGEVRAHKSILIARAPLFKKMFSSPDKRKSLGSGSDQIKIPDAGKKSFDAFLQFVYCGQLPDDFDIRAMLNLSEKYDVPKLDHLCSQKLKKNFDATTDIDGLVAKAKEMLQFSKNRRFEEFRSGCEQHLVEWIERNGELTWSAGLPNQRRVFLDQAIALLVLSHVEGCPSLKQRCLRYFDSRNQDGSFTAEELEGAKSRLAKHPDLLSKMVWRG